MNRQKTVSIVSAILLIIAVALISLNLFDTANPSTDKPAAQSTQSATTDTSKKTTISYTAEPGISSLDQLKKIAPSLVTKQSEYGEYVDTINGYKGGDEGKYWSFYVDGEMSTIGAGSYMQVGGEEIVWKFQKL